MTRRRATCPLLIGFDRPHNLWQWQLLPRCCPVLNIEKLNEVVWLSKLFKVWLSERTGEVALCRPKQEVVTSILIFWIFLEIFTKEKTDLPNIVTAGSSLVSRHCFFLHGSMFLRRALWRSKASRFVRHQLHTSAMPRRCLWTEITDRNRDTMYAATVYMRYMFMHICRDYIILLYNIVYYKYIMLSFL